MTIDIKAIGAKWQAKRKKEKTYKTTESSERAKFYALDMFPYPSGAGLHVGHPKGYLATDSLARLKMLQGYNVLHPMGFDAFGLPAEQYAIKNKVNPSVSTAQNVTRYKKQLESMGFTYDRDREVNTTDPKFYKWTQRTFLKLYNHYYDAVAGIAKPIEELEKKLKKQGLGGTSLDKALDQHRLAFVDYKPINRCPSCKTGLANEDLDNGKCERCGSDVEQKPMRQWVIRITDYAQRLLDGLDELPEWPDNVKEMQRNRIGKSEGTEFVMQVQGSNHNFSIYTTRVDTVFGMSFVALAPEHPLVQEITSKEHTKAVAKYVKDAANKTSLERDTEKEKTGVFTGAYAINPFTKQPVPIWVADYVLMGYGSGAVMAVPAHDERDWAFAKKYGLPIVYVVGPSFGDKHTDSQAKISGYAILIDPTLNKIVVGDGDYLWNPGGTIELGENIITGTQREIIEETGYIDIQFEKEICCLQSFYHTGGEKNVWRENNMKILQFTLKSEKRIAKNLTKDEVDCPIIKVSLNDLIVDANSRQKQNIDTLDDGRPDAAKFVIDMFQKHQTNQGWYTNKGILIDCANYTGMESDEAIAAMQARLKGQGIGGKKIQYRLQDWVFSRQRYWGEPIPMIHGKDGSIIPMKEKDLPLELPMVEAYEPTGSEEGPLANIQNWVNVPEGKRETNTMPQWAGSSRYWLRYMDPNNNEALVGKDKEKYRGQVDVYVGGLEHATRHLIYGRFWHKFLYDIGVVSTSEPFKKLYGVGLVLAEDGRKMSKRWNNVINPDDVISEYGADAFRTYEMFMGPFENEVARSTAGVKGVKKFLDKICKLVDKVSDVEDTKEILSLLHKSIKKVGEDIENFRFNTAVSQLMILVNNLADQKTVSRETIKTLALIIAPFAPHLAEEIWEQLGEQFSIFHTGKRPNFDPKLIVEDTITIAVQFNGKMKGTVIIAPGSSQNEVLDTIKNDSKLQKQRTGEAKKIIYVPEKIVNIIL